MSPPEKRKEESPVPPVAGERTWTIFVCPDHGLAHGADPTVMPLNNYCAHCAESNEDGSYYLAAPVEVVELSRLRAAEERLRRIDALLDLSDTWTLEQAEPGELIALRQPREAWLEIREALASLEQKEEAGG